MNVVLGMDAAWGGLGWCLATEQGPVSAGHVVLRGAAYRWPALLRWLDTTIRPEITDGELLRGPADAPLRLVIEEPPVVYSGASRGPRAPAGGDLLDRMADAAQQARGEARAAGNQSATCYGLGRLAGALEFWWAANPALAYPWLVDPAHWRKWWKLGGRGRVERKQAAVDLVTTLRWGRLLGDHKWNSASGGPRADVAEAILLAVGAARNASEAPAGPMSILTNPPPVRQQRAPRPKKPPTPRGA